MISCVVRQHLATRSTSHGCSGAPGTSFAAGVVPDPGSILGWLGSLWGRARARRYLSADLRAGLVVVCLVMDVGCAAGRAGTRGIPAASRAVVGADVVGDTAGGCSRCGSRVGRCGACRCLHAGLSEGAFCLLSYPFVVVTGESYRREAKRCQQNK